MCATNIFSDSEAVEVFDSIPASSSGCFELHRQLATILHCSTPYFKVCHVDVQRQSGGSDCGLFAIAFTLMLCQRKDPRTVSFLQSSMRGHLVQCFEQEVISDFPHSTKPRRTARSRFISEKTMPVYCVCRLPWWKGYSKLGPLIRCDSCKECMVSL